MHTSAPVEVSNNDSLWSDDTVGYLSELRRRLLFSLALLMVLFLGLLPWTGALYEVFSAPIVQLLPEKKMIATSLIAPVWVPIKLTFYFAAMLAMPVFLYQLWRYFAPALYQREKKWFMLSVFPCVLMFYLGMWLAYAYVLPLLVSFIMGQLPANILFMPEMNTVLAFSIKLIWIFGCCFQVPVMMYLLCRHELISVAQCQQARKYVIVAALIIGMLLTPPDVVSQIVVAIPIYLLYELGVAVYRLQRYVMQGRSVLCKFI